MIETPQGYDDVPARPHHVLYTGGTFDLFHRGHVNFLRRCRELSTTVVVALNTDEFVAEFKGEPPLMTYAERRAVIDACVYVDAVVKNIGGSDSKPSIEAVGPDVIAIGTDWQHRDYHKQMDFTPAWLEERGISLVYLPYTEGVSTTDLKNRLLERFDLLSTPTE